ncbi:PQQ-dependent sugar dehydrogenase [Mangrovimicrobium sediminis]|uniref:PQQ-dependent sugar dehydrogenase n=1 Tax=Mangrovimicrobium sediminis TaxID=2562682 RepID=UPI001436BA2E|nr:PQQ-dependent sugar dehydrogenase [Haliea sp. SAOS-164]
MILFLLAGLLPALGYTWLRASGNIAPGGLPPLLNAATGYSGGSVAGKGGVAPLQAPPGFEVTVYAEALPGARMLLAGVNGDLLLSRPAKGDVILLAPDRDGDGRADGRRVLLQQLDQPQGLAFLGGWLYVAEQGQVGRIGYDHANGTTRGAYQVVIPDLPRGGNHWRKTLRAGPDAALYLAIGSSCNVCAESDPRRATLMRFAADGSAGEVIASGLRNAVDFDWSPFNGKLYATDNGRDLLGDDFPPCELNLIEPGRFYGWPYFNGDNLQDPDMGPDPYAGAREPTPPVHGFRAHNAPLGLRFIDASHWPQEYRRTAIAALHGSWNRSELDGYKLVSLHFGEQRIEERDFLTGFLTDDGVIGRPVALAQGPGGALFVSDDYAGVIYRVTPPAMR